MISNGLHSRSHRRESATGTMQLRLVCPGSLPNMVLQFYARIAHSRAARPGCLPGVAARVLKEGGVLPRGYRGSRTQRQAPSTENTVRRVFRSRRALQIPEVRALEACPAGLQEVSRRTGAARLLRTSAQRAHLAGSTPPARGRGGGSWRSPAGTPPAVARLAARANCAAA